MTAPYGTHYLRVAITQGVDGPQRPPVTFPAGTRIDRLGVGIGQLRYAEVRHPLGGTAAIVVRDDEVAPIPPMPPMSTRYPLVIDGREASDHGHDDG
jgi:hypothetical protein